MHGVRTTTLQRQSDFQHQPFQTASTRLQDQGIIKQFTVDIDRLKLQQRTPVIITFTVHPTEAESVYQRLRSLSGIEHLFKQYDGTIIAYGNAPDQNPTGWLAEAIDLEQVGDIDIELVEKYEWAQELDAAEFSLPCPVCDNTVRSDGITATIGDRTLAFCCPSCKKSYQEQYDQLEGDAD